MAGAYGNGICETLIRSFVLEEKTIRLNDRIIGVDGEIRERFITRIPPVKTGQGVRIDDWVISCIEQDADVIITQRKFKPRLSICKMDMKPVETAYLIDFVMKPDGGDREIGFLIAKGQVI